MLLSSLAVQALPRTSTLWAMERGLGGLGLDVGRACFSFTWGWATRRPVRGGLGAAGGLVLGSGVVAGQLAEGHGSEEQTEVA